MGVDRGRRLGAARLTFMGLVAASLLTAATAPARAEDDLGSESWSDKLSDKMKDTLGNATHAIGLGKPEAPPTKEAPSGCPTISILDGTTAQRVMAPGATGNAGVRYQYSLYHVGRECDRSGSRMSVKIGADGRVLLGPAGGAGHFDVPIRVVIYSEVEQKPVESKLYRVPASIVAGQSGAPFQFVSDQLVVPVAAGRSGSDYSIKVGIDGGKGGDSVTPKKRHRRARSRSRTPDTQSASQ